MAVLHMEDDRIPIQAMFWQMDHHIKRKRGRPRKNWIDTICQDLKRQEYDNGTAIKHDLTTSNIH